MNPKKIKDLLLPVAAENDEDLVLLHKLNNFYWDKVRETLTTTPESTVRLFNLGEFERKYWRIDRHIKKAAAVYEKLKGVGRQAHRDALLKDLQLLEAMQQFCAAEENRKSMKNHIRFTCQYAKKVQSPDVHHKESK